MTAFSAPLSSSSFFGPANSYYRESVNQIAVSTARLSSGSRLIRAGDDVAALSISTRMQGELVALRQASTNIAQGSSLLQVAYDALSNIGDILDRMQALATQSNSGSLTTTERGFLQTEFSSLIEEIDRISENTSFNNINLLDGTLSGQNTLSTTTTQAEQATASLVFASIATGNTIKLNGVTITADTDFAVGGSVQGSIDNLVSFLNTSTNTALSGATYARQGTDTLTITYDSGGELGSLYYINQAGSTASFTTSGGTATTTADVYTLSGGEDNGLHAGSVSASGTIGDALVTTQAQVAASATIAFSDNASNGETFTIDDGDGGTVTFTFVVASASSTQITIGSDIEETLTNTIAKISQYSADEDYGVRSLEFERSGSSLIIRNKQSGNPLDLAGSALNVTESITNATISTTTLNNGTNTGVNASGVNNSAFVGEISGFTATYNSADNIDVELTVGDVTYSATISDTTPVSATTVRFNSDDGGFFDVQIAASGFAVADQDAADEFASRLDNAFSTLTFSQKRNVSSFSGSGDLTTGTATFQTDDFATQVPKIRDIIVTASTGSNDALIEFDINGETYRSGNIDTSVGAYEKITLTSTTNSNNQLSFTIGSSAVDLSSQTLADAFEEDLRASFGLDEAGGGVDFQIGTDPSDTINVNIGSSFTNQLFAGVTPSIATQSDAEDTIDTITTAQNSLTESITNVGVLQERFDFAADNVSSVISGLDTARANLADTDVVEESTIFAQASLRNSAAIAIIAQAQKLQSGLLGVLDFG